jgi:methanogenic corrinoid protein MtbC1
MTKHLTSFEGSAGDIAKYFEDRPHEVLAAASGHGAPSWRDLLGQVIEREILPGLLESWGAPGNGGAASADGRLGDAAVAAFVQLIIEDDVEQLRAVADRVILHTGGREALLNALLTPAARLMGRMWEEDACDFMTVTLGVYRLNQIMRETEAAELPASHGLDHHILLLPAPGEQHSFGVNMVADAFRAGGWCVRSTPAVSRKQLLQLVEDEWFDVVGLSVSTERCLKGLPSCIRALRAASGNARTFVLLGGHAVVCNPERSRFLGADSVAQDAENALRQANNFMETTVTERGCQFNTKPNDAVLAL